MPQSSIAYAIGSARAPSRRPLGRSDLERLFSASGYEEARRQLADMGYGGGQDEDAGQLSVRALGQACAFLRRITPDPALTNAFLLRYDAQNLKILLKARILGEEPRMLAGATDIGLWVTKQLRDLGPVAFIAGIDDLRGVHVSDATIRIGATTTA